MAKATKKVHELAKELGIKSKEILEKCHDAGLANIKAPSSAVSAGLEATIREWFAVAEEPVEAKPAEPAQTETAETKPQETEKKETSSKIEVSEPVKSVEDDKKPSEAAAKKIESEQTAPEKQTEAKEQPEDSSKEKKEDKKQPKPVKTEKPKEIEKPEIVMNVPKQPLDVKPVGNVVVPAPAKLSGPKVIRVEAVENVPKPGRKKKHKPDRSSKPAQPQFTAAPEIPIPLPIKPGSGKAGKKGKKGKDSPKDIDDIKIGKASHKHKIHEADIEGRKKRVKAAQGGIIGRVPRKISEHGSKAQSDAPKKQQQKVERPQKAAIAEPITVKDLSAALTVKINDIILKLMQQGVMATANQTIATDVAQIIALDFGTELEVQEKRSIEEEIREEFDNREGKKPKKRPAIVTMLGHVDHGKTSLLDKIRSAAVATGEAGGITQHIGAYQAELNGKKVTFLDTPGHAAFTAMRSRGANMTDIVVLVVAADDGVMPQTVEAIRHAQAADVTIVVALNKIDLPGVDENRVYGQLAEHGLTPQEWGGDTEIIKTSAETGQGIPELIEHLDLIAELNEYQADSTIPATGWVVEAKMTTTQGVVATILIKEGRLRKGDIVFAGSGYGKIRNMKNSFGKPLKEATSSMPVEITGLSEVPQAGDRFYALNDLALAKNAADQNKARMREENLAKRSQITFDNLFTHIEAGSIKELNLIIRADVQGSVDVLIKHLTDLSTDEIKVKVLHAAVGGITEGDVVLAEASSAIIIGFNVVPEGMVRQLADAKGVDIRLYNIIYRITEDLSDAMAGMLEPEEKEVSLGKLVVRNTFKVPGVGTVAGCYVTEGIVKRNAKLRLIRNNIVIKDNCETHSLKHFKDDVKEVRAGFECGLKIANFDDVKNDDVIEAYEIIKVARSLK